MFVRRILITLLQSIVLVSLIKVSIRSFMADIPCCGISDMKHRYISLALVSRKALVCVPGKKIILCKRGTTLSFLDIKLSRSAAPGDLCHHRGRNEENSTLHSDHRCNVTKVIGKIRKRCQGRRECWINLNERYLGKACVMEVKFLQVNFTCDQSKSSLRF